MFIVKRNGQKRPRPQASRHVVVDWERILRVPETARLQRSLPARPCSEAMRHLAQQELAELHDLGMINVPPPAEEVLRYSRAFKPAVLKPMLAKPIHDFEELRLDGEYLYEEKFDGERMLCFVRNCDDVGEAECYSRTLKPIRFPFKIPLNPNYGNCIFDGELVFLDSETEEVVPICDTGNRGALVKQFRVFDVQMINGEYVTDRPLIERKQLLSAALSSSQHVRVVEHNGPVCTPEEIFDAFNRTVARNGEGLIVKRSDEQYAPGNRDWIKIKELHLVGRKLEFDLYVDRIVRDKNGILSVLECGYYDEKREFRKVCSVSSGLDSKNRTSIRRMSHENGKFQPYQLVVTIVADKITKRGSLRHPIFTRIRNDLSGVDRPAVDVDPRLRTCT